MKARLWRRARACAECHRPLPEGEGHVNKYGDLFCSLPCQENFAPEAVPTEPGAAVGSPPAPGRDEA